MAYIDKYGVKSITSYFDQLGFPIQFFDTYAEEKDYDREDKLRGFITTPIRLLSSFNGDEYNLYYSSPYSSRITNYVKKDDNNNLYVLGGGESDVVLEKTKSGSKFLSDAEVDTLAEDTEYVGKLNEFSNLENFSSIDAPDYSVIFGDNPQVSEATPIINIQEITDSQFEQSKKLLAEQEKLFLEIKKAENEGVLKTAMWTFDEVDALYNSKITSDDKRAYFIYLQNKCGKKLKGEWDEKYGSSYPAQAVDILELIKKGRLFVDLSAERGERLQPRVIYRSGNIWKKYSSLTNRKDEYVKRFGEEIFNLHLKEIKEVWQIVWQNRLRVSGDDNSVMLRMLPISEIANEFRISQIVSPKNRDEILKNFQVYTSFRKGERIEDIAGLGEGVARLNYVTKSSLTLQEGFIKWCKEAGDGQEALKNAVQWSSLTTGIDKLLDRYLKPISNPYGEKGKDRWEREKDDASKVGNRLFAQFLKEGIIATDQEKLEIVWNSIYNAFHEPVLEEVPIGFTYKKYLDDRDLFKLKESNLNALRYFLSRGSVGLAYGVGMGKTFCSIFVMKQALDLGICERPLLIVPNQVYFQFGIEVKRGLGSEFNYQLPDSRLNMFYNGKGIYNRMGNKAVNGINLCTYEATSNFIFAKDQNDDEWLDEAINILEMGGDITNPAIREEWKKSYGGSLFGDLEVDIDENEVDTTLEMTDGASDNDLDLGDFSEGGKLKEGKAESKERNKKEIEPIYLNSPDTKYDFVCVDEAHNFNNLFTSVIASPKDIQKGEKSKKTGKIRVQRETNPYSKIRETGGGKDASAMAQKLYWITRYIQNYNRFGNTLLLSATPFTNSPLQVYTMMTFLNYDILFNMELGVIKDFFDLFAKIEYAEDFRTDLTIVKRNKFIGWTNAIALQKLVYRYFDKSTREQEDKAVIRPQKIALPLKRILKNGKVYDLAKENFVSTTIKMSDKQVELWEKIKKYAQGDLPYEELCNPTTSNTTSFGKYVEKKAKKQEDDKDSTDGGEVDVENPDNLADGTKEGEKSHAGVRRLQCLMWGRQLTLNPYLFKCSGYKTEPTPKEYVEASPKLLYVMKCIQSVKEYSEKNNPRVYDGKKKGYYGGMSGQIIYMNFGIDAFPLLRDYLVSELGFKLDEIGIISGKGNYIGKKLYENKKSVQDAFLGQVINSETGEENYLTDEQRVKVLIGSEAIKEGINLQDFSSVLYNCFLDFNPTDRIQLEGRLWRQGNRFANVRIVTPLIADCIDVFMFQKLEDKTERINQIWTRNGQLNELDTTSFDPAELKYELISDPNKLALLEIEHKKEVLEEQKTDEVAILSDYINVENSWNKGELSLYPPINNDPKDDFRALMYYNICQIRPDLIDKPLLNQQATIEWNKNLVNWERANGNMEVQESLDYSNLYYIFSNRYWDFNSNNEYYIDPLEYVKYPKQVMLLEKMFNYTAEEIINLMVQVCKEQKIAFPRGYSKNWREILTANIERPIVEGDEVEFDTKKGRKKGTAELVQTKSGQNIIENFFYHILYQYNNNSTDKDNIDKAIKELKLNLINLETLIFSNVDEKEKRQWITLLKYMYEKNPNNITGKNNEPFASLEPYTLDADDFEDLNIAEKNIVRVKSKDESSKQVVPTKYPEPFTYTNKDVKENLLEIYEYLNEVMLRKYNFSDYDIRNCYNSNRWFADNLAKPVDEQLTYFTNDKIQSVISIVLAKSQRTSYRYFDPQTFSTETIKKEIDEYFVKAWVELQTYWTDGSIRFGLFQRLYNFEIPRNIADFYQLKEKKFAMLGINNRSDLNNLLTSQKEKINAIDIEKNNLDDPQIIQETIQEVQRRQEELNSEEIRSGSSYTARAKTFATCNPDYLGNEMLSIFMNTPNKDIISCGHDYSSTEVPIVEVVEDVVETPIEEVVETPIEEVVETPIEEVVVSPKTTQELIDDLVMILPYETAEEKKKTRKLIKELKMAMMFE
jgi:hypothetical protein